MEGNFNGRRKKDRKIIDQKKKTGPRTKSSRHLDSGSCTSTFGDEAHIEKLLASKETLTDEEKKQGDY